MSGCRTAACLSSATDGRQCQAKQHHSYEYDPRYLLHSLNSSQEFLPDKVQSYRQRYSGNIERVPKVFPVFCCNSMVGECLGLYPGRLLKNPSQCHPEVAPVFGERRICLTSNAREQQILRCAQDDTLEGEFFRSLLEAFRFDGWL